jgi:hypothetical protein
MKALVKLNGILAVAIFAAVQAHAVLLLSDDFNRTGPLVGTVPSPGPGGVWTAHSGTTAIGITGGQADLSGARSQDANSGFGSGHSNDVLWASFDVTFTLAPTAGASTYFAHFKDASTFNFYARVIGTNVAGAVGLGITTSTGPGAGAAYAPGTFALSAPQHVVIRLDQSGPNGGPGSVAATLWLNPVDISSANVTATDAGATNLHINVESFALRQSTGEGNILIDNLMVGTTAADVGLIPEPSTMMLVSVGLAGLLGLRRRRS